MNSVATRRFWDLFYALPEDVQELAVKNYHLWRHDPHHPSLRFRRLHGSENRFSVRVGDHYRALGRLTDDTVTWVWIGTHTEYDRLVGSLGFTIVTFGGGRDCLTGGNLTTERVLC